MDGAAKIDPLNNPKKEPAAEAGYVTPPMVTRIESTAAGVILSRRG